MRSEGTDGRHRGGGGGFRAAPEPGFAENSTFFPQNDHSDPGFAEFSSIFLQNGLSGHGFAEFSSIILQNDLTKPVLQNYRRFFRKMGPGCREGLFIH